jgi:hypothetical protein
VKPRSLVVLVVAAFGATALTGSLSAPARSAAEPLGGLNAIRAKLGLEPLTPNRIAARLVGEIAARDVEDGLPETLDSQPDCAVCEVAFGRKGLSADPREIYVRRGGAGMVGFALWRARWGADQNLSVFFRASALVLDPRARTFSASRTPRGLLLLAVTIDPSLPFRRPVRWPTGRIDPRRQLWVQVVLPPGTRGPPRLLERRGANEVIAAYPLAETRGLGGARLVSFGLSTVLAYAHRYRVHVGSISVPIATRAAPAGFVRRSWTFAALGERDRRAFLAIVRRTPTPLQRIFTELDGATLVLGRGHGCFLADACERVENGRTTIGFRRSVEPFVVMHELGHVVFDIGLDETGRRLFRSAFIDAGWRTACCTPLTEIFADQLAFWALGGKPGDVESYADRMFLPRERFAHLLRQNAAYRPASAVGLLKR